MINNRSLILCSKVAALTVFVLLNSSCRSTDPSRSKDPVVGPLPIHDASFDILVSAYGRNSMSERERNIRLRESLNAIAEAIKDVRSAYFREDQQLIDSLGIYSHVLDILGSEDYQWIDSYSSLSPPGLANIFPTTDDLKIWKMTSVFLSAFEVETQRNSEIKRVFSGVPFEEPLKVVERIRHEPVLFALLANIPTHKDLGELLEVLKIKLPRPLR